jgi:hypothetical protein
MSTQTQVARTTCTKKSFTTSATAESFASELQIKYPTQARQSAYACEDCPNWHLSAMDPVAHGLSRANISSSVNIPWAPGLHRNLQHLQTKIKEAYSEYMKANANNSWKAVGHVCSALNITDSYEKQTIRTYLVNIGVHNTNPRAVEGQQRKNGLSVESLESQEQQLEKQLSELHAKKMALIEAKAIKITNMLNDEQQPVVVIRKEGMSFVVSPADAYTLVEKLEAHLAALPN